MKTIVIMLLFVTFSSTKSFGQFGVGIHQTNIPFVGFNYQINEKYIPEFRLGTDSFFENMSIETVLTRIIKKDDDFQAYAGIGARLNSSPGLVIPIGLNIYPLENKQFGFHIELAGMFTEEGDLLRATWGLRYRFKRKESN
jgi:hypothetical protein